MAQDAQAGTVRQHEIENGCIERSRCKARDGVLACIDAIGGHAVQGQPGHQAV